MARRRHRRTERHNATFLTPHHSSLTLGLLRPHVERRPADLRVVEDRRRYHPLDFFRPALMVDGVQAPRNVVAPAPFKKPYKFPAKVAFAVPRRTVICVRRKQRKEVLHALGRAGRRGGRGRKRRNWFSSIVC